MSVCQYLAGGHFLFKVFTSITLYNFIQQTPIGFYTFAATSIYALYVSVFIKHCYPFL